MLSLGHTQYLVDDILLQIPYIQLKKVKYALLYRRYLYQHDGNRTKGDNPHLWQYHKFYQWWQNNALPYTTATGLTGYGMTPGDSSVCRSFRDSPNLL